MMTPKSQERTMWLYVTGVEWDFANASADVIRGVSGTETLASVRVE